jgi:hypothetical protein
LVERLPYKQEVARSSRAPPILADPLPKRSVCHRSSKPTCPEWCCGSVVEALRVMTVARLAGVLAASRGCDSPCRRRRP